MIDQFKLATPIGIMHGATRGRVLTSLSFDAEGSLEPTTVDGRLVRDRLLAYFSGELVALDALETAPQGTAFQQQVWVRLRKVAVSETISYGALAAAIGRPSAVRAVAGANARNPVAVVIPCHRVIGSDGTLTGYAGGLERKRWLLEHESRTRSLWPALQAPSDR